MSLSSRVNEKASLIWAIADKLTGVYKPHEYGEVILPLTVLRRFDCILADTKPAVLDTYNKLKDQNLDLLDGLLYEVAGHKFYNISKYTFKTLLDDPDNIESNFRDYINGFSDNVQDIIRKFKFDNHITTMADKHILYMVIKEFTTDKAICIRIISVILKWVTYLKRLSGDFQKLTMKMLVSIIPLVR